MKMYLVILVNLSAYTSAHNTHTYLCNTKHNPCERSAKKQDGYHVRSTDVWDHRIRCTRTAVMVGSEGVMKLCATRAPLRRYNILFGENMLSAATRMCVHCATCERVLVLGRSLFFQLWVACCAHRGLVSISKSTTIYPIGFSTLPRAAQPARTRYMACLCVIDSQVLSFNINTRTFRSHIHTLNLVQYIQGLTMNRT